MSKIKKEDYTNIQLEYLSGDTLTVLADRYGVHHSTISKILDKKQIKKRKAGNPFLGELAKNKTKSWIQNQRKSQHLFWQNHHNYRLNNDSYFEKNSGENAPEWLKILKLTKK